MVFQAWCNEAQRSTAAARVSQLRKAPQCHLQVRTMQMKQLRQEAEQLERSKADRIEGAFKVYEEDMSMCLERWPPNLM